MGRRLRDSGSFSVEMAIIFPAFIAISSVVLVAGAIGQGQIDVGNAAQEGARAATLERNAGSAAAAGRAAALAQIGACGDASVDIDLGGFQPGSRVTVTVQCTARGPLGQSRRMSATAAEVIDSYRGSP